MAKLPTDHKWICCLPLSGLADKTELCLFHAQLRVFTYFDSGHLVGISL